MNLIGHIPGVGPTALFNPGVATPAPWNVAHTGATDGTGPANATKNMAEIYNRMLLQVAATIQQAGLAIDNTNWAQLPAAIVAITQKELATVAVPAGDIHLFARNTPPTGYLKANGALVSRATYSALFASIGVTFGVGDGVTTFGLPDLRGEFIRAWDDGRGVDSGRAFGSAQGDAIRNIVGHAGSFFRLATPAGTGALTIPVYSNTPPVAGTIGTNAGDTADIDFNAALVVPTAAENRPRSVAMLACIKY